MADVLTCQFVDSPSATAALRYDFFVKTPTFKAHILNEGFDLGAPAWTGEPQGVGGTYDYRQMRFTQRVEGTKAVAMARLSLLAKEMQRPTNWLKVQLASNLSPVYFKTYRTDPGALSLEYVEPAQAWDITVPLVADPFAYGARQTISQATLGNALNATNPLRLVLPTLKGDAPTYLRVKVSLPGITGNPGEWLNGVVSAETGSTVTDTTYDIGTGDGFTAGTGTSAGTAGATYLGGSYRSVTISAVTPPASNLLERLSGTLASTLPQGRYKVFLRGEGDPINSTTPNHYSFAFGLLNNGQVRYGTTVFQDTPPQVPLGTTTAFQGWVDLGDFAIPFGVPDIPRDVTATITAPTFSLKIGTSTGAAGTFRPDALKFVPIGGPIIRQATLLRSTLDKGTAGVDNMFLGSTEAGTWDGDDEIMWGATVSTGALIGGTPVHRGSYPIADPSAGQNVLLCFPLNCSMNGSSVTAAAGTWTVDASYYPRYLHIGDGT